MKRLLAGRRIASQEGFALVLTMVMLVVLAVLGLLVLDVTNTDLAVTSNYRSESDAFVAAERAAEYATNPDILFETDDTHLALLQEGGEDFVTDGDETVAGHTVADRFAHLQDPVTRTELVKSDNKDVNVVKNLGPSELPAALRSKFGDDFAGNYYLINIEARSRNDSRAGIETEKVRIFKKSDDSVFVTTSGG